MVRKQISADGQEFEVVEVDFEVTEEQWNRYKLLDGGEVRLKTTPLKVYRVLDSDRRPSIDQNGDPVFVVNHATQVIARSS